MDILFNGIDRTLIDARSVFGIDKVLDIRKNLEYALIITIASESIDTSKISKFEELQNCRIEYIKIQRDRVVLYYKQTLGAKPLPVLDRFEELIPIVSNDEQLDDLIHDLIHG